MVLVFIMVPEGKAEDKLVWGVCSKGVYNGCLFVCFLMMVSLRRVLNVFLCCSPKQCEYSYSTVPPKKFRGFPREICWFSLHELTCISVENQLCVYSLLIMSNVSIKWLFFDSFLYPSACNTSFVSVNSRVTFCHSF